MGLPELVIVVLIIGGLIVPTMIACKRHVRHRWLPLVLTVAAPGIGFIGGLAYALVARPAAARPRESMAFRPREDFARFAAPFHRSKVKERSVRDPETRVPPGDSSGAVV